MGRSTVYNNITSPEKIAAINPENQSLMNDFLEYLESVGRAASTIKNYRADLLVFFCWCLDELDNKSFIKITKREIARFQSHAMKIWGWSSARLRTVKAAVASLGNFVETILDDEYDGFRSIVRKVESPPQEFAREKTILSSDDVKKILDAFVERKEHMKACIVALAAYGGRRKSELTRYKVHYFDDSNLICDGALYQTPEPIRTKGRGKQGKMLTVYTLAKQFKPYFDMWMAERERLGIQSELLFPKFDGEKWLDEPISTTLIDSVMNTCTNILGRPVYAHSYRHFMTTYLSEAGLPAEVIKDLFGWSSVNLVDVYCDTTKEASFEKYFGAGGIKKVENKSLSEL